MSTKCYCLQGVDMDEGLLESMKQTLPKYAVNCFIYAGYDNIPAITQMITAEVHRTVWIKLKNLFLSIV